MGPHFMLLMSIYVLYSNVTYIYIYILDHVEIKLFQIVSIVLIFVSKIVIVKKDVLITYLQYRRHRR